MVAAVTFPVSVVLSMSDQFSGPLRRSTGVLNKFSKSMVSAGRSLTAGLSLPLGIAGGAALKTYLNYENALQDIRIASDLTESSLRGLKGTMKDVAERTKFSPAEVGIFSKGLLKGGLSAAETQGALPSVANLAVQAPEVPLDDLSNSFISILRATNTPVSEASRVADLMTVAANNTTASVGGLLEGFKLATSAGTIAGLNLQDTIFGLGLIKTGSALGGTMSGVAIGRALLDLAQIHKRPELASAFAKVGIRESDFFKDGKFDLASVLSSLEGLSKDQRNSVTGEFEQRGMRAMIGLLNASAIGQNGQQLRGSEALQELRRRFAVDIGIAAEKAAIKMEGLSGRLRLLQAQAAVAAEAGINPVTETLSSLVSTASKGMLWFAGLEKNTRGWVVKTAAWAAILGPATIVLGHMAFALSSLKVGVLGKLLLTTPWGQIGLAAGTLAVLADKLLDISGMFDRLASGEVGSAFMAGGPVGALRKLLGMKRESLALDIPIGKEHGLAADQTAPRAPPEFMTQRYEHVLRIDEKTGYLRLFRDPLMPSDTGLTMETD